jgi:hypothetical protein
VGYSEGGCKLSTSYLQDCYIHGRNRGRRGLCIKQAGTSEMKNEQEMLEKLLEFVVARHNEPLLE